MLFWTGRANGRNAIYTMVFNPQIAVLDANGQPFPAQGRPMLLPAAPGLSEEQEPVPVARQITYGSATDPVIDLTFSGKSEVNGTTDIYTSRYAITNRISGGSPNAASIWKTILIPFGVGVTDILTSDQRQVIWKGQDVQWVRDPSRFQLMNGASTLIPLNTVPSSIDTVTGKWTFNSVPIGAQPNSVIVDPRSGIVEFGTQPLAGAITTLTATVAAQAVRISSGSLSNTQPTVFIDDALKPNAAPSVADPTSGFPTIPPVQTARYWYIFRKSATGTGTSAATSPTLYFNTRRLSVLLPFPMSLATNGATPPAYYFPTTSFDVEVSASSSMSGHTNISASVDIDWKRNRIDFPEQYEGMYVTVQYLALNPTANVITTSPIVVQWLDEPYVNDPTQPLAVGERPVPLSPAVNESSPSAILDPAAYGGNTGSPPQALNPHRVWLFWSSARNTDTYVPGYPSTVGLSSIRANQYVAGPASTPSNPQYFVAKINGPTDLPDKPGSLQWAPYFGANDIYWESLDPRFEISYP